MLTNFLPGQEEGNVPFVVDGGFGAYADDPPTIAATVGAWLDDPSKLRAMSARALDAGAPRATLEIAGEIAARFAGLPAPPAEEAAAAA